MDLDARYQEITSALKQDHRYLKPLNKNEIQYLIEIYPKLSLDADLEKFFCVLCHTQTSSLLFSDLLIEFLKNQQIKDQLKIFALEATRKHVIDAYFKQGKRLPASLFESLKSLLYHKNPEIVEWALRILDESGSQSIILRLDVKKIRPSIFKLYNKNYRTVLELCEFLERKWNGNRKN